VSEKLVREFIRMEYNLHRSYKIRNINMEKQEFVVNIGSCFACYPFGKALKRELRLEEILK